MSGKDDDIIQRWKSPIYTTLEYLLGEGWRAQEHWVTGKVASNF